MDGNHKHPLERACDNLCHLNDEAWHRYWQLMHGGCPEQAETLRTEGIWA